MFSEPRRGRTAFEALDKCYLQSEKRTIVLDRRINRLAVFCSVANVSDLFQCCRPPPSLLCAGSGNCYSISIARCVCVSVYSFGTSAECVRPVTLDGEPVCVCVCVVQKLVLKALRRGSDVSCALCFTFYPPFCYH